MEALKEFSTQTFSSLKVPNYRLYFIGQGFSHVGNWMQTVGLSWLVLQLTGSGTALGTVLAFRFMPMLLGGPFAGIIVDRFDKRRILFITQSSFAVLAFALAILVYTDFIQTWMFFIFAMALGLVDVIDNPTRQTFVHEMVGRDNLRNAVTLNATEANVARAVGPMIAGTLIATVGIAFCFLANSISFIALIAMLLLMDKKDMHTEEREEKPRGHLLESISYAASVPVIKTVLIAMAVIGTLSYEFQVSLPLLAQGTFAGAAADYAALLSAMGAGSVAGGLFAASRKQIAPHEFVASAFFFGLSIAVTASMPTLSLAIVGMVFVGFFSINLTSLGNTMIQLAASPHMRGRVMSLWSMAIFGSTLVGAPFVGLTGEYIGPRWGLAIGGIAAMAAAVYAARTLLQTDWLRTISESVGLKTQEAEAENLKL
ncbi:MFS transporter [Candidatus Kaiserbacteria bacterium]|nr:MFS transporter [Candidatus Kaiserbacteria bacterium]